jgi:hypothetical protein
MIAHEERRELLISLADGKQLSVKHNDMTPSPQALENAKTLFDPDLYTDAASLQRHGGTERGLVRHDPARI